MSLFKRALIYFNEALDERIGYIIDLKHTIVNLESTVRCLESVNKSHEATVKSQSQEISKLRALLDRVWASKRIKDEDLKKDIAKATYNAYIQTTI